MNVNKLDTIAARQDDLRHQIADLVQQFADITFAPQPFEAGQTPVPVSGKVVGAKERIAGCVTLICPGVRTV